MILDIDHITITSDNIDLDGKFLESLGYKNKFVERNIKNSRIKKTLLKQFKKNHDISFYFSDKNFSIELINHNSNNKTLSSIIPLFEKISKDKIIEDEQEKVYLKNFNLPIRFNEFSDQNQFNSIVLKTKKTLPSINFWKNLGFKLVTSKKTFSHLKYSSVVNNNQYNLFLEETKDDFSNYLDNHGITCIALLSNSSKKEKDFLSQNNIKTTEIDSILLNGKIINVFFAISGVGDLAEIISIKNN